MMKTKALALALLALAACDKTADEQSKIDKAKSEANQNITSANMEAEKKIANANTEAAKKIDNAENKANEKIGEANEAIVRAKADFTKSRQDDLATLDKKLAELDTKAMHATGKAKTDSDITLTNAHKKRDAFAAELSQVPRVSATTWDVTKTRLDDAWTDVKKSVDAVKL